MASLSGRNEALNLPPSMYLIASTLNPAIIGDELSGMATFSGARFLKLSMALLISFLAKSNALSLSKGINKAPSVMAMSDVETISV